jgi:hypothetical protein
MATLALVDLILKFAHGGSRWMQRLRSIDPVRAVAGVFDFRLPWLGPPAGVQSRHRANRQQRSGGDDGC